METIVKENVKYYELSYPQKRILRIENLYPGTPICNIGGVTRIKGKLDINLVMKAIEIFMIKNENLRFRIVQHGGDICQYIHEYEEKSIPFKDFSNLINPQEEAEKWARNIFNMPFKLFDSDLYRIAIYKAGEESYGLMCSLHHIISDGWSTCIVQKRVLEIYFELLKDENHIADIEPSYVNFLEKERKYIDSNRFIKDREYFKEIFSDVDEEFLYNSEKSCEGIRRCFNLSEDFSKKINKFLLDYNLSINTFFTLIMTLYLNKIMNKDEIIIGNLSFNRMTRKERATIGMCANIIPLKIKVEKENNFIQLLDEVGVILKKGFYHQQYPYNKLIEDLNIKEKGYDSLFRFRVNCYKSDYFDYMGSNVNVEVEEYYNGYQNYSSQIITKEIEKDNIILCIDYKSDEYTEKDINNMYKYMINIINNIIEDPQKKIKEIL